MRAFLRPTWVTWAVAISPLAPLPLLGLLRSTRRSSPCTSPSSSAPSGSSAGLGLSFGRRGDWFGYAFPNALGWTLIGLIDVMVLYLVGSVASAAWLRARPHRVASR